MSYSVLLKKIPNLVLVIVFFTKYLVIVIQSNGHSSYSLKLCLEEIHWVEKVMNIIKCVFMFACTYNKLLIAW